MIAHAAAAGWQWGRDIIFTYGPLGYLRYPIFDDALLVPALAWNALLVAVLIAGILALLRPVPTVGAIAIYVVIVIAASGMTGRGVLVMLPLLAALLYFREPGIAPRAVPMLLVVASGVYANVYVASLPFAVFACVLMDASRFARRRWPLFVPLLATSVAGAFAVAGQDVRALPDFIRSAIELTRGYADAMGIEGSIVEVRLFVVMAGVAAVLVWRLVDRALLEQRDARRCAAVDRRGRRVRLRRLEERLRAPRHAAQRRRVGLACDDARRVCRGALEAPRGPPPRRPRCWQPRPCRAVRRSSRRMARSRMLFVADQAVAALYQAPLRALGQAAHVVVEPRRWIDAERRSAQAAYARIRAVSPPLVTRGSVDLIGHEQGILLARGLDYRPLPVFQGYGAYTRWLIERNRERLRSALAPDTIFASTATIDDHYPMLDTQTSIVESFSTATSRTRSSAVMCGCAGAPTRSIRRSACARSTMPRSASRLPCRVGTACCCSRSACGRRW